MRRIALLMLVVPAIGRLSELRPARELVSAIGLGYTRQHRRDPYGNESRYRGFVHIRTAPGLNETVSAADDRRRIARCTTSAS
jgi:hypothetical protein